MLVSVKGVGVSSYYFDSYLDGEESFLSWLLLRDGMLGPITTRSFYTG
jgi:hypothetical protein